MARKYVVAKEKVVVVVGAKPIEYGKVRTRDRRTGEWVEIENQNVIVDPGSDGVPHVFKAFQKVPANHEAVKQSPGSFMPIDDADEADLETAGA